jgi:hypothetical protein
MFTVTLLIKAKKEKQGPSPVVHNYNPSYSGDGEVKTSYDKKLSRPVPTNQGWWSGSRGRAPA